MHTLVSRAQPLPRSLAAGAGLALVLLAAGVAAARPVHAAPAFTVDTVSDGHLDTAATTCVSAAAGGRCTLRAAIELNEGGSGGAAITLNLPAPGQITLTLGELDITKDVAITGPGPAKDSVSGGGTARVVAINSTTAQVVMSGLSIVDGTAATDVGGGVLNFGSLTLSDVVVRGNTAGFGGGIADAGTLTLRPGTVVTANSAVAFSDQTVPGGISGGIGGGVAEFGKLTGTGILLSGNTADEAGGNVGVDFATVTLPNSEFVTHGTANVTQATITQGDAPFGGGAWLGKGESATFLGSTFVNNVAAASHSPSAGGALVNFCGALTLTNDTLVQNRTIGPNSGAIQQGCSREDSIANRAAAEFGPTTSPPAIRLPQVSSPKATSLATPTPSAAPTQTPLAATGALDFVTMAENTRGTDGPSTIELVGDTTTLTIHDSIIARKSGDTSADCLVISGAKLTSLGYNLENGDDCSLHATGDQVKVDAQLGALASNGGATQTMALTAGTPAVDTADPRCDVKDDQRGVSRPQGGRCDIGAFELQATTPATPTPLPAPPVTGYGPAPFDPSRIALILALLALPLVGAGLLIARVSTSQTLLAHGRFAEGSSRSSPGKEDRRVIRCRRERA